VKLPAVCRRCYAVIFWTHDANSSAFFTRELEYVAQGISGINDKALFALLDPCPIPQFWLKFQEPYVQLFADAERS